MIGTLYALGAKKRNLILHYVTMPVIISFLGGLIGSAIGFSSLGIDVQMENTQGYFSIPKLDTIYPLYLVIYRIVMPPVISLIVNVLVINKKLSQTALSLIRNEQKAGKHQGLDFGKMRFVRRFQIRQMMREMRTGFTVIIGMVISLLIFMLGMDCYVMCNNVKIGNIVDASYGYMYTLKFGFRTKEIRKLYLNGNLLIVIVGAILGIPIAKAAMDTVYPWFIANTACGMDLDFPWYLYAGTFAGILTVYAVVNCLLVRKIKRITPAEVLKNRE